MGATCPHPFLILSLMYSLVLAQRSSDAFSSLPQRSPPLGIHTRAQLGARQRGRSNICLGASLAHAPLCGCWMQNLARFV